MAVTFETFTRDYNEFREKLGQRSFWELPVEKRDAWFHGLGWAFIMLKATPEENERASTLFESVTDEYARRQAYVLLHPLPPQ
jgi:hypothetical protein